MSTTHLNTRLRRSALMLALIAAYDASAQDATVDALNTTSTNNPSGTDRAVAALVVDRVDLDASGAVAPAGYGGSEYNRDFLRGFKNESALRNGKRDYNYLGVECLCAAETIEVLKGPASALFGNGKPGGDLNTVVKMPGMRDYRNVSLLVNSPGITKVRIDAADVLNDVVSYRLNAQANAGAIYTDYNDKTSEFFAPVVELRLSPRLKVTMAYSGIHMDGTWNPLFVPNQALLGLPARRFLGEKSNKSYVNDSTTHLELDYTLDGGTHLRQALFYEIDTYRDAGLAYDTYNYALKDLVDAAGNVKRVSQKDDAGQKILVSQSEVFGRGSVFRIPVEYLLGLELGKFDYRYALDVGAGAPINIYHPVYGAAMATDLTRLADQVYGTSNAVVYSTLRFQLDARTRLLLGMRAERYRDYLREVGEARVEQTSSLYSPRIGATYQLAPAWIGALSWTNSSRPQIGAKSATGGLFKPEGGTQTEASMQYTAPDDALKATTSVFAITKKNVLTQDLASPNFQIDSGRRQSRGVELDLSYTFTPALKLDVASSYTNAHVSEDTVLAVGTRLAGVAKWFTSMYLGYDISPAWTLGAGYMFESRRAATLPDNGVELPAMSSVDVTLSYKTKTWSVDATLVNIADKPGYTSDGFTLTPVNPRELQIVARYKF